MRIGIISPTYPYQGSAECVFVEALVNEFAKMGHNCTVIAPFSVLTYLQGKIKKGIYYEHRKVEENVYVDIYKPKVYTYRDLSLCGISYSSYIAGRVIEKTIEKHNLQFDVIYCHFFVQGLRAFRCAQKRNIPMIVATGESTIQKLNKPYKSFSYDTFKQYVKGVVCVSIKNLEECISMGYADRDKCKVIPNAVNLNLFSNKNTRNEIREKLAVRPDEITLISVGEFCNRKGQNRVIEAVKCLRKEGLDTIKMIFIGKSLSKEFCIMNDKNIVYKGPISHDELPDYLYASDIFILPTLREGCCNAIIEGMACGLPIISSDSSFNYDILDSTNSIMIDPNNIEAIGNAIKTLVLDKTLREQLGQGAKKKAETLSIKCRASKIIDFIKA